MRPQVPNSLEDTFIDVDGRVYVLEGKGPNRRLVYADGSTTRWCQIPTPVPPERLVPVAPKEPGTLSFVGIRPSLPGLQRLWTTPDLGATWRVREWSLPAPPNAVFTVATPEAVTFTILRRTAADGSFLPQELWESRDLERSWQPRAIVVPGTWGEGVVERFHWIRTDPAAPARLVGLVEIKLMERVGTVSWVPALVVSEDGGRTWTRDTPPFQIDVAAIDMSPQAHFLAIDRNGTVAVRDGTQGTWRTTGQLTPNARVHEALLLLTPRPAYASVLLRRSMGPLENVIFRSELGETDWRPIAQKPLEVGTAKRHVPVGLGHIVSQSRFDVQRTWDDGSTWQTLGLATNHQGLIVAGSATDRRLYLFSNGHLHRSNDGGLTWTATRLTGTTFGSLAVAEHDPNLLFGVLAESSNWSVLRSPDGGTSWSPLKLPEGIVPVSVLPMAAPGTLLSSTQNGIFRSEDNGQAWTRVHERRLLPLRRSPILPGLTAGCDAQGNLWRSEDGGKTWTEHGKLDFQELALSAADPDVAYGLATGNLVLTAMRFSTSERRAGGSVAYGLVRNPNLTAAGSLIATAGGDIFYPANGHLWHARVENLTWQGPAGPDDFGLTTLAVHPAWNGFLLAASNAGLLHIELSAVAAFERAAARTPRAP